jgi:hypothetical protein
MNLWDGLLFTPQSPAVVALFRVCFGLVLFGNALVTLRDAPRLLRPDGVYPFEAAGRTQPFRRLNLFAWLPPTVAWCNLVLALHLVAVGALVVGALTPLAALVTFVTLTSIHHRNAEVVNSADSLCRLFCFWLILAPAGWVWSLDATWFDLDPDVAVDPWALRLLQFQLLIVYWRTGWWKMRGREWRDGSAVWLTLTNPEIRRRDLPARWARPPVYRALTWGTLAFELGFPVLVWVGPLRYPMLAVAVGFHLLMHVFLRIPLFPWVMLAGLVLFLPPDEVAGWLS